MITLLFILLVLAVIGLGAGLVIISAPLILDLLVVIVICGLVGLLFKK